MRPVQDAALSGDACASQCHAKHELQGQLLGQAVIESFFSTLKIERVFRSKYKTRDEARADIFEPLAAMSASNCIFHASISSAAKKLIASTISPLL